MRMKNLCFVVETGTDVRMVEGLAEYFNLTILYRQVDRPFVSQPTSAKFTLLAGPTSRANFSKFVFGSLTKIADKFDYVIVQSYGLAALAANLASRLTAVPTSMLVCSPVEAYYKCRRLYALPGKPFRWYELLAIRLAAIANGIVGRQYLVLSQHLASVVAQYGLEKPIRLIPLYGVDTNLFRPAELSKAELKAKLGLPTTGSLIFFSSRIAPEKDSETLLIAFRQLLDEGMDLWLLHRSGGYKSFMQDAENYGVAERVIATNAVHPHLELPKDYQACDLCVQSSRQEGLGFSPLEALSCETPVVASSIGGLLETITPLTGWSYPVGDSKSLADCMREALLQPAEARLRAQEGRRIIQQHYDRGLVFSEIVEIVNSSVTSQIA